MDNIVVDAMPWVVVVVLAIGALAYAGWWLTQRRAPSSLVAQIEQHLAPEGTVIFVRLALVAFGTLEPGARQYRVDLTTPFGSRSHTVEVDQSGRVRTVL